ncbi:hypothetical protein [Aneurinibacillus uraniidurans]|uniref:hypothetical protein n=1 Tax=Aneurinibacillus uraniidurans TaxID=2966586 RepID=UPI002349F703|nr:hypothetical protein [Aneurinibacillus sp. B1]WCN36354.1 hypothetical protein PO771_10685 [Aneurinibacillus sp. B1]
MAKHTLTKWVISLSSVVAFTGFVGLSKQADATKAATQSAEVQMQPITPAAQQPVSKLVQPETVKTDSQANKEEKHHKRKYEQHNEDDDKAYDDGDHEEKTVVQKSTKHRSTAQRSSYAEQETAKKPAARSRAS